MAVAEQSHFQPAPLKLTGDITEVHLYLLSIISQPCRSLFKHYDQLGALENALRARYVAVPHSSLSFTHTDKHTIKSGFNQKTELLPQLEMCCLWPCTIWIYRQRADKANNLPEIGVIKHREIKVHYSTIDPKALDGERLILCSIAIGT